MRSHPRQPVDDANRREIQVGALFGELATRVGPSAAAGSPRDAVAFGDVVVISVPWSVLPLALEQAGPLDGTIVVDTTNQFGGPPLPPEGQTAASFNAARMPGARYTKSFNTLTSAFQAETAGRGGDERVVQWLCGDDAAAKEVVARLSTTPDSRRSTSAAPPDAR